MVTLYENKGHAVHRVTKICDKFQHGLLFIRRFVAMSSGPGLHLLLVANHGSVY